jgi:hypothetical protein
MTAGYFSVHVALTPACIGKRNRPESPAVRRILWLGAGLFLGSCVCGTNPGTEDSGTPITGTPCTVSSECAFGEDCVDGFCGTPVTPDAGTTCTRNEDCPTGQICLPSTGECITPTTNDSGEEEDGGVITGNCNPGDTTSCGSSKLGLCKLGTATCQVINGAYDFGPCSGNIEPVAELCNGLDDDCDGLIDDGFADLVCGFGECRRTVPGCLNGAVNTCTPGSPSTEICDNKDNDCNQQIDDMPAIQCGTGACRRSAPACDGGIPGTCTPGGPTSEQCNGQDDDCNGSTDDGFAFAFCGQGVCFNSVYPCANGVPVACQALDGGPETCANTTDDNCNGLVNEGCACNPNDPPLPCYSGPNGTADAGVCRYGTQGCDGGQLGTCVGQVVPSAESCNNADDNCNGVVDDMGQSSCGQGVCARTVQNCIAGVPQTCVAGDAGTEVCNALDDDCDGTADNNIANLTCGTGACFRSVPACRTDGGNNACVAGTPAAVESCNGVDDNCDGFIDNNVPSTSCSTGQAGPCAAGTTSCSGGLSVCVRSYTPVAEICMPPNGIDDDCNGSVDIAPGCCNAAINLDSDPANQCTDCNDNDGTIYPDAGEKCNGKDDNCNGQIDEGFDKDNDGFTLCGTMDGGGLDSRRVDCNDDAGFVFPGKTFDCGPCATAACPFCSGTGACVAGTGNSIDDNCNGYVDETCGCNPATDRDNDGANECLDCNDSNNQVRPGLPEVCDGLDNDCNRATTPNCGVSQPCGYRSGPSYVPFPTGTDVCKQDLVCVTNVATGQLTCGSYCNQTAGLGLNDSCLANQACDRRLIDSDKLQLCSEYTAWTGITQMGNTCSVDTDCASHDCYLEPGTTTRYCSDGCNHESACPNNTTCNVANSLTVDNNPGTVNDRYMYVSRCRRDANITGTLLLNASCTADTQCRSGVCFQGTCAEPCCAHQDCTGGRSCGYGPDQNTGYTVGGRVVVSMVPVCRLNVGTRPSGAACAANADCRSRLCDSVQGICVDICCNDTSCTTPGQTCEPVATVTSDGGILDVVRACVFSPIPTQLRMRFGP